MAISTLYSKMTDILSSISWEKGESSSAFSNSTRMTKLLNDCNKDILRRPEIAPVKDEFTIPFTGNGSYALDAAIKKVNGLHSGGPGVSGTVLFAYYPPVEFETIKLGYAYTFKTPGKIEIFANSVASLPSTTLTIEGYSRNLVLDADTITKKVIWANNDDTSLLPPEYDDIWVFYVLWRIKRRETPAEAQLYKNDYINLITDLAIGGTDPIPARARSQFGYGG